MQSTLSKEFLVEEAREKEIEERAEDIKAIRRLLTEAGDISLIQPWAFIVWAVIVAAVSIIHYQLYMSISIDIRTALAWIELPALILGAIAESVSWALNSRRRALPLFNRRLGGAILSFIASSIVIVVVVVRLALVSLTPGIAVLFAALPIVFYAQISYGSLFIETFVGIAVGLLFEFAGATGPALYLAGGLFAAILYAVSGLHIYLIERRQRG